jgi:hypothetical protein
MIAFAQVQARDRAPSLNHSLLVSRGHVPSPWSRAHCRFGSTETNSRSCRPGSPEGDIAAVTIERRAVVPFRSLKDTVGLLLLGPEGPVSVRALWVRPDGGVDRVSAIGYDVRGTARLWARARLWTLGASRHAGLEGGIDGWL